MTQPTAGFGQTAPSPRRASASAARIAPRSTRRSPAEPGGGEAISLAIRRDPSDKIPEILGFAEIAVDRGETDISNLIEASHCLHDESADIIARDIGLARTLQLPHQRIDDALHPLGLERPFAQRDVDRSGKLVPIEGFTLSIFLDYGQFTQLDALEGCEAGSAIRAEASAADRAAIVRRTRILNLGIIGSAKRAAHLLLRLLQLSRCGKRFYPSGPRRGPS